MLQSFHFAIKPVEKATQPRHPFEAIARRIGPHSRQHGVEREAHEQRDQNGDNNGHTKLIEEQTNDATHERHRRKHGNNRKRRGQNGEADFFGRL